MGYLILSQQILDAIRHIADDNFSFRIVRATQSPAAPLTNTAFE